MVTIIRHLVRFMVENNKTAGPYDMKPQSIPPPYSAVQPIQCFFFYNISIAI